MYIYIQNTHYMILQVVFTFFCIKMVSCNTMDYCHSDVLDIERFAQDGGWTSNWYRLVSWMI